ncbi:hypothetical protein CROQUDRAFT_130922 [Cronartium quercuum f. sp. fusiforme G11]|uniref:Uncharacterized protein n=1 Tax=Cronartium quercuum f. sp. fusiforme G11 TaxID=708437 RepID=A0A9P6NQ12_9BASI|nr:hypothetical protein CROQUDRAFT_130922 [Cronartium quercuum f. sp. fusiforme G11]
MRLSLSILLLLSHCKVLHGELLTDTNLLHSSLEGFKPAKLRNSGSEAIPCTRLRKRSILGLGCKGNSVIQMVKSRTTRTPYGAQVSTQNSKLSNSEFERFLSASSRKKTSRFDALKKDSTNSGVKKYSPPDHHPNDDDGYNPVRSMRKPPEFSPIPEPKEKFDTWGQKPKSGTTNSAKSEKKFIQALKGTFRTMVWDHGEPELDHLHERLIDFFQRLWKWFKSIPKTYRILFGHEPDPESLTLDAAFLRESRGIAEKVAQSMVDSYLLKVKRSRILPHKEALRKAMVEYMKLSVTIQVKDYLAIDPTLVRLILPDKTRAMLINILVINIKDRDASRSSRLDCALLLKFIERFGESIYAKLSIKDLKYLLAEDAFGPEFSAVEVDQTYIYQQIQHQKHVQELENLKTERESALSHDKTQKWDLNAPDSPLPSWISHQT